MYILPLNNLFSCGFIILFFVPFFFFVLSSLVNLWLALVFILYLDSFLFCSCESLTDFWLIIMRSINKTYKMLHRFAWLPCTEAVFIFSLPFQFSKCAVESSTEGFTYVNFEWTTWDSKQCELVNCSYFKSHHCKT